MYVARLTRARVGFDPKTPRLESYALTTSAKACPGEQEARAHDVLEG